MIVPGSSANDRSSTARSFPKRFVSDSAWTAAAWGRIVSGTVEPLPCGGGVDAEVGEKLRRRVGALETRAAMRAGTSPPVGGGPASPSTRPRAPSSRPGSTAAAPAARPSGSACATALSAAPAPSPRSACRPRRQRAPADRASRDRPAPHRRPCRGHSRGPAPAAARRGGARCQRGGRRGIAPVRGRRSTWPTGSKGGRWSRPVVLSAAFVTAVPFRTWYGSTGA